MFWCHPIYKDGGAIFNCMPIQYEDLDIYPCKLAAIVVNERKHDDDDQYTLIIQSAKNKTQNSSLLFQEWEWSNDIAYESVLPSSINSTCFVVSMSENSSTILETTMRNGLKSSQKTSQQRNNYVRRHCMQKDNLINVY